MGHDVYHLQRVHETHGRVAVAFQSEGYHAARTVGQIFAAQLVVGVVGQSAIVHPCHPLIVVQELGHPLGIGAVLGHAQV